MLNALFKVHKKNGSDLPEFSTKKFIAVTVCFLAIVSKVWLVMLPTTHWLATLTAVGVSDSVIITASASLDALSFACLSVYGIAKAKGAA